jgi:hypothetical protein
MSSSATLLIFGPESNSGSEKAGHPGDNALFVVVKELKSLGFSTIYTEVATLPKGAPLPLARRAEEQLRSLIQGLILALNVTSIMRTIKIRNKEKTMKKYEVVFGTGLVINIHAYTKKAARHTVKKRARTLGTDVVSVEEIDNEA